MRILLWTRYKAQKDQLFLVFFIIDLIQTKPMSIPIAVIQLPDEEGSSPNRAKVCICFVGNVDFTIGF